VVAETKEASRIEKPLLFAPMTLGAGGLSLLEDLYRRHIRHA
jgi:hypothetical protein